MDAVSYRKESAAINNYLDKKKEFLFAVYGVILVKPLQSVGTKGDGFGRTMCISLQHEYYRHILSVAARILCHKGSCTLRDSTKKVRVKCHQGGCGQTYPYLGQNQMQ